nr:transglutaminase [Flavobacterium sp.]
MIKIKEINFQALKQKFQVKKPWDDVIIFVLNILIAIPLFIILHQNLINPNWYLNIDRVILFIAMVVIIQIILRFLRTIIIFCIVLYVLVLAYGSTIGNYGFNNVYEDYNSIMYTMSDNPYPQDIIIAKLLPFPNKSKIINAIEYE